MGGNGAPFICGACGWLDGFKSLGGLSAVLDATAD